MVHLGILVHERSGNLHHYRSGVAMDDHLNEIQTKMINEYFKSEPSLFIDFIKRKMSS